MNARSSGAWASSDEQRQLLELAERVAQLGSWQFAPETGELHWSDNLFRLFGLEPGSVIPTAEYVLEMTHPDDQDRRARWMEQLGEGVMDGSIDYRIIRADGAIRYLRLTMAEINEDRRPRRILATVQDITDQRLAEREIAAHVAVEGALTEWESFERGAEGLVRNLAEATGAAAGALWVWDDDHLAPRAFWRSAMLDDADEFEAATSQLRLAPGAGLPGRVWRTGIPIGLNVSDRPDSLRTAEAEAAGLCGAVAFPALNGEEVLAVVELYSREGAELSERLMRTLVGLGHVLGQFLAHHRKGLGVSVLTPRELEVLQLAAQGNSRQQTAELLTLSPATVKTHMAHINAKLGVSDRAAAVARAVRDGLID